MVGEVARAEMVPQGGPQVERLHSILKQVRLPSGFSISLYALVPNARHLAVGPTGKIVFVGTRNDRVWTISTDMSANERRVQQFAPNVEFTMPNGSCFDDDGALFITEQNRILKFANAEKHFDDPEITEIPVVPYGDLIPKNEESRIHSARVCRIGPDGKLYVSLGQPYNVTPNGKLDLYDRLGIGGIIRMNLDGSAREVYALGARNSVGMDFNPANGELWWTDNQVDGMGDDIPPGELNRQTAPGQHFGFPYYGGGDVRTKPYLDAAPPAGLVFPAVEMDAHAADLGMMFYAGKRFPKKYQGGIFSAQHGSWDRSTPIGARVMFTAIRADGSAGKTEVFADGWIDRNGSYLGRPVDVAELPDGSLLVSDDSEGAIYRITYGAE